jgi:hypothetical protein
MRNVFFAAFGADHGDLQFSPRALLLAGKPCFCLAVLYCGLRLRLFRIATLRVL